MNTKTLIIKLGKLFPQSIAKRYNDFVGLMAGSFKKETNKVLLCLDFDEEVYEIAKEYKPDLIITHHPFIYGKKKDVFLNNVNKEKLYNKVIKSKLCIYSMHTNFDAAKGGMNDSLAESLKLNNIYAPKDEPMMRIGELKEAMPINKFALYAKEQLKVDYGLLIKGDNNSIKKVGIVGGAGSGFYKIAKKEKCDIFISGDVPHHIRREIISYNFSYLDLPHEIEKIFIKTMYKVIKNIDSEIDILKVDHEKLPKVI